MGCLKRVQIVAEGEHICLCIRDQAETNQQQQY